MTSHTHHGGRVFWAPSSRVCDIEAEWCGVEDQPTRFRPLAAASYFLMSLLIVDVILDRDQAEHQDGVDALCNRQLMGVHVDKLAPVKHLAIHERAAPPVLPNLRWARGVPRGAGYAAGTRMMRSAPFGALDNGWA